MIIDYLVVPVLWFLCMALLYGRRSMHLLRKYHIMVILQSSACYYISSVLHLRLIVHMHHTGSQENEVEPEEQETLVQELSEGHEPEEELQECSNHRPSSIEKGKHWSILCLPNFQ